METCSFGLFFVRKTLRHNRFAKLRDDFVGSSGWLSCANMALVGHSMSFKTIFFSHGLHTLQCRYYQNLLKTVPGHDDSSFPDKMPGLTGTY